METMRTTSGRSTGAQARGHGERRTAQKECLAACPEHLVDLTILHDDGCMTLKRTVGTVLCG